jgi:hypothetical protein
MSLPIRKLIFTMMHPEVLVKTDVDRAIRRSESRYWVQHGRG